MFFVLFGLTLFLMWLVMAAPIGVRTLQHRVRVKADPSAVWNALFPFGENATWHHSVVKIKPLSDNQMRITTGHMGRDGNPILRDIELSDVIEGERFSLRCKHDTSLADGFWEHHHETIRFARAAVGTEVTYSETDKYRGIAFLAFRFFAQQRMARQFKQWIETGTYQRGGWFDRIETQFAMAALSALLIWPLFGLTTGGLMLATALIVVVALHELGHVAAFRISGHKSARMVFLPLLGGLAMGSRPYNTHFEIAFAALMGAGFSAFVAAGLWAATTFGLVPMMWYPETIVLAFLCAAFNLGNILPIWKFDGGQILRQIFRQRGQLYAVSLALLVAMSVYVYSLGTPLEYVFIGFATVIALTFLTGTNTIKPRNALVDMRLGERLLMFGGLIAVISVHAIVMQQSLERLLG